MGAVGWTGGPRSSHSLRLFREAERCGPVLLCAAKMSQRGSAFLGLLVGAKKYRRSSYLNMRQHIYKIFQLSLRLAPSFYVLLCIDRESCTLAVLHRVACT